MHAPCEEKSDDVKHRFYEELDQVSDHFPKYSYHVNIPLGDFEAKLKEEDIFKSTIGNENLHQDSTDNVRVVNFAT
jgi:hypothetical protein